MVEKILSKGFSKEDEPFLVLTARFHTAILIFNYILFCILFLFSSSLVAEFLHKSCFPVGPTSYP